MVTARRRRQRTKHFHLSLINVVTHPHSPEIYQRLFKTALQDSTTVSYLGDRVARIGAADVEGDVIVGALWLYTLIDSDKPMLNVHSRRAMTEREVKSISFDWSAVGFNYKEVGYAFDIKSHRLCFNIGDIAPRSLVNILSAIFQTIRQNIQLDSVAVSLEQTSEGLDTVMALHLQELRIYFARPNPDDLDDFQEEFEAALAKQNAASEETILKAVNGQRLKISRENEIKAQVALSNGTVKGIGLEEGGKRIVTRSTESSPVDKVAEFNPNEETFLNFLSREVKSLSGRVLSRLRKR